MCKRLGSVVVAVAALFGTVHAHSAPDAAAPQEAAASATASKVVIQDGKPPNDQGNYLGDRVLFHFSKAVDVVDMQTAGMPTASKCLPAGASMRGIGKAVIKKDEKGKEVDAFLFVVTAMPEFKIESKAPVVVSSFLGRSSVEAKPCSGSSVVQGDVVSLTSSEVTSTPPDRYGLTYGAMFVPYKYQIGGDGSFGGKSSVGGYVGYRQSKTGTFGLEAKYVVFLGGVSVPVLQNVDGKSTLQNITGVSYGVGILGTLKNEFQIGLMIGADRVSKSAGYVNNGKPWIAASLGFAFSQ